MRRKLTVLLALSLLLTIVAALLLRVPVSAGYAAQSWQPVAEPEIVVPAAAQPELHPVLGASVVVTDPITVTQPLTAPVYLPILLTDLTWHLPWITTPAVFSQSSPTNGSLRSSLNAYLEWQFEDSVLPNAAFNIFLEAEDDTPDEAIAWGLTRRAFDPFTFEEDTTYYWRVEAFDSNGKKVGGPVWSFHTDYLPETPELDAMVTVPEGEFLMGCDPLHSGYYCIGGHGPLHAVWISEFELDKYEVTNGEYAQCVADGACNPPRLDTLRGDPYYNTAEYVYHPVLYVSHWDAQDYCAWEDKRLPTEAEWEKAARGAMDTRPWPWGDEHWTCKNMNRCIGGSDSKPARVDSFLPGQSPYGAVHLAGNVFEWVEDYHSDFYPISPYFNPVNLTPTSGVPFFVMRGGGYADNWWYARTNHRQAGHWGDKPGHDSPLFRSHRSGFRCARSEITESAD